jgi:hypothetical protein|tara:strand:- start:220 stop:486 length:267 start_codon:yes stop_codon:yes gene_type:complete
MRNNEKEKVMGYWPQTIADQMKKGMSNENSKICEIGRILRDLGLSNVAVNYHMNVDENFIPDVLSCYKGVAKRQARSSRASSHWPYVN